MIVGHWIFPKKSLQILAGKSSQPHRGLVEPLAEWVADSESLGCRWQRLPTNQRNQRNATLHGAFSERFFFGANKHGGCSESGRYIIWGGCLIGLIGDVTLKLKIVVFPFLCLFSWLEQTGMESRRKRR